MASVEVNAVAQRGRPNTIFCVQGAHLDAVDRHAPACEIPVRKREFGVHATQAGCHVLQLHSEPLIDRGIRLGDSCSEEATFAMR